MREKNKTELICKNNILQKELDCFKKSEISKCAIFEKRNSTISCCSKLINENKLLKSKVNKLELITRNFFPREKSFNVLLENQLFVNKRKGLGFAKVSKYEQTTNNTVKGKSVIPKCVKCGNIGHGKNNCRNIYKHKTVKQIWIPKSTNINGFKF